MVKLSARSDHIPPFFCALEARYHNGFIDELKEIPGPYWDKEHRVWLIPIEIAQAVRILAERYRISPRLVYRSDAPRQVPDSAPATSALVLENGSDEMHLRNYQLDGAATALKDRSFLLSYEMGLGKSGPALRALRAAGAKRVAIIAPASVLSVWVDQLTLWWPGHPKLRPIEAAPATGIYLISWAKLEAYAEQLNGLDAIIFDELHYAKNPKAQRSKAAFELRKRSPEALVIGLTGTPIGNEPKDLHNQLDLLYPKRFGTWWKFVHRYCNVQNNGYGLEVEGLNPDGEEELRYRLAQCSQRVAKSEVADQLPPFLVQTVRIPAERNAAKLRQLTQLWLNSNNRAERSKVESQLYSSSAAAKVKQSLALLDDAFEAGERFVVISTHLKSTAASIHEACAAKRIAAIDYIDGDTLPIQRGRRIDALLKQPKGILIATLHSIKEGLNNLVHFSTAISAEMSYSPLEMAQYLGRFSRLNSKIPSRALLLVQEGTPDEQIAYALKKKTDAISRLYKTGAEGQLNAALSEGDDEESFIKKLREAAAGQEADCY